jgi:lysylphosphatidylglycerol synthase-like protein
MLLRVASRRRVLIGLLIAIAGSALLAWQIRTIGLAQVLDSLRRIGAWFIVILALALGRFTLRSLSWATLIGEPVPLRRVLAATLSGDAIGNLTPLGLIASEPAKAMYVSDRVGPSRALSALAVENFFYSISVALYIIIGTGVMLTMFTVADDWFRTLATIVLAAMAGVLAVAAWAAWQKPQVASAVLARVPFVHLDTVVARVREFEIQTYGTVGGHWGRLAIVAVCESTYHVLSFAESFLMVSMLSDPSPVQAGPSLAAKAFVMDTVNRATAVAFKMVPARLGVDEAASGSFAVAIGLDRGVGVAMGLVRKGRLLVTATAGLLLLVRRAGAIRDSKLRVES